MSLDAPGPRQGVVSVSYFFGFLGLVGRVPCRKRSWAGALFPFPEAPFEQQHYKGVSRLSSLGLCQVLGGPQRVLQVPFGVLSAEIGGGRSFKFLSNSSV